MGTQHTGPLPLAHTHTCGHTAHTAAHTPSHLAPRQAGCHEAQCGLGHLTRAMCCPALPRRPPHQPCTSLHSAMASGITTRTLSRRSVTGVVGRTRRLRRSRPCWDPRGSQGWPGPPLRTTSQWKQRTGPQSPVTRGASACVSGREGRRAQDPEDGKPLVRGPGHVQPSRPTWWSHCPAASLMATAGDPQWGEGVPALSPVCEGGQ